LIFKVKRTLLYILFSVFLTTSVFSKHIVGGEMIYDYLGGNKYRITLKVYRDCFSNGPNFDGTDPSLPTALVTIFYGASGLVDTTLNIGVPVINSIPHTINNPCIQPPNNVCVEEGVYTYTVTLPPQTGGYYIVYQRCCRNNTILNLVSPGDQGATYYTKIPGPEAAAINSSPRFKLFPPIFICDNLPFTFDHSATDPDGDQLVYSLCAPFLGCDVTCPSLGYAGCPSAATPPPYLNVNYSGAYSGAYPIASNPAFSINPVTGILTGRPNLIGQFVVGVRVQEYRGNQLINTHYRDFQFNVSSCIVNVASIFADQVQKCEGNTINFVNQSFGNVGALSYAWDFGVPNLTTDTSSVQNPTYVYPDTGKYIVTLIANPGKPCSDTMKKTFYIYPALKVNFDPQNKQCLKGNSFNFNNTGTYINGATFNWNFTSAATPSTSTLKSPSGIVFNQAGKYYVKLVGKQLSCVDSLIDTVRIIGRPTAKINNLPNSLCDPAKVGFSNGSTSDLPISYKWIFSDGTSSDYFEPVKIFTPPGVYGATLIVTTTSLCIDTSVASVQNITVNPKPKAGFSFSPTLTTIFDPEITFKNEASDDVNSWSYTFGDGSSSNIQNCIYPYQNPGIYIVEQIVSNPFNCSDTAQREVTILPEFRFWIPNTFTPNRDGLNDIFMPKAIGVLNYQFDIFDKWGQKIYSGTDYKRGWDGTFNGLSCEQDVYVWIISFRNEVTLKQEHHQGYVLLLRSQD
jgi:gliding motility-associated-like protein